jgi:hypothetical protein
MEFVSKRLILKVLSSPLRGKEDVQIDGSEGLGHKILPSVKNVAKRSPDEIM